MSFKIMWIFGLVGLIYLILYGILGRIASPLLFYRFTLWGRILMGLFALLILTQVPAILSAVLAGKNVSLLSKVVFMVVFLFGSIIISFVFKYNFIDSIKELYLDKFGTNTVMLKDKVEIRTDFPISNEWKGSVHYVSTIGDKKDYTISYHFYRNQLKKHLDVKYFGDRKTKPQQLPGIYCLKVLKHSSQLIQIDRCGD